MDQTEKFAGRDGLAEKLRRGDVLSELCPSRDILKHMTSRWGLLVLVALLGGTHRFSELRRRIGGISEKMLAETLQGLEGDGLIRRVAYPVVPPHVEYSLTPLGEEAAEKVRALVDWIEVNVQRMLDSHHLAQQAGKQRRSDPAS